MKHTLLGLAAAAALVTAPGMAVAKELSFATFIPATSTTVKTVYEPWIEWFNNQTSEHGVTIRLFAGGSLGRSPLAQADLVRSGVADITLTVPSYTPGVYPDFDIFELPNFLASTAEGSQVAHEMYREGLLRGYEEFYVIAMYTSGTYMIHTKNPVASVAELRDKRIRVAGQIQTAVVEALGGVPVTMGAGEMAENIDRGLVDGAMTDASVARSFRVADVATNHLNTSLGVLVFAMVLNKDVYDGLPEPVKAALEASGQKIIDLQAENYGGFVDRTLVEWEASPDHTLVELTDADMAALEAAVAPVVEKVAAAASPGLIDAFRAKVAEVRAR